MRRDPTCSPSSAEPRRLLLALLAAAAMAATACAEQSATGKAAIDAAPLPEYARSHMAAIRGADAVAHAKVLSNRDYHGRRHATPGARLAAEYVAAELRKWGLRPGGQAGSYYQFFKIRPGYQIKSSFELFVGSNEVGDFKRKVDYRVVHLPGGKAAFEAECVLVGYGVTAKALNFDEYANVDVRGRWVIIFSGSPFAEAGPVGRVLETLESKALRAATRGAAGVVFVDNPVGWRKRLTVPERLRPPDPAAPPAAGVPIVHVTRAFAAAIVGMDLPELRSYARDIVRDRQPSSMLLRSRKLRIDATISGTARMGRNVLAVLPGREAPFNRQTVVVGAHYDHLGENDAGCFFGANDNAAGVGALLCIARAFATLPVRPRRSVVFVAFDAEEIGKLGSHHYIKHPVLPIEDTVLMINFDMIGRNEPDAINAVATRSSDELHALHQAVNGHVGLRLVHPQSYRLGRSDHSPFYFSRVPVMYLFGGLDRDYNTPRDTWDKLIPGKIEKVARLAFLTALGAAEQEKRLRYRGGDADNGTW